SPLAGAEKAQPASLTAFGAAVEVNVVNVEVYATDKGGKRVNDLRQGDFEILEDGKPVAITNFTPVRLPAAGNQPAAGSPPAPPPAPAGPRADGNAWALVVYVDNANIAPAHRTRALEQIREFLAHNVRPGDRVMLVTSDAAIKVWQPLTSDPAALDAALGKMEKLAAQGPEIDVERRRAFREMMIINEASIESLGPPCPANIEVPARGFAASRRAEVRRSLGALTLLVNSLSGVPGRKAVLHVSDGLPAVPGEELYQFLLELCGGGGGTEGLWHPTPTASGSDKKPIPTFDPMAVYDAREIGPAAYQAASQAMTDAQAFSIAKDLATLVAHANAHQVTLYTLQASGVSGTDASDVSYGPDERLFQFASIGRVQRASLQESLQTLAEGTGGKAILNANDWRPDLAGLKEDFETFYSLGYSPAHNGDGKEHKIEVRVKRPSIRLRYRLSYRDKPAMEKAVDRTLAALLYGVEDNPLEIAVEMGDQVPGASGTFSVPIRLRIPLHKLAILNREQTFEGSLRLLVASRSEDGRSAPVRQVSVPIKIPRQQVLNALGQYYVYTLTLQLPPGNHRVAVGVRDEIATTTSFLSREVAVDAKVSAK
ncbi:MAG TPA: VWA domain-containing protein, partial [Thermoanaerobaculia bacterium]|nr:VWA domain-containing protein [Thermoanaerobaculia bacterium]